MLSETEYVDSGESDTFWYENDLMLAAELGKTLLERNKDLECELKHIQQIESEQTKEIDLLTKQLDVLRNVNESRMRIYEEVDRNLQETEKTNARLQQEAKADKDTIKKLTSTLESLELKCEDQQGKLEDVKQEERERKKREKRTWSVPSLTEASDLQAVFRGDYDYLGFPSVLDPLTRQPQYRGGESKATKELRDQVRSLKLELGFEKRKRCQTDAELTEAVTDNEEVRSRLDAMEKERVNLEAELRACEKKMATQQQLPRETICKSCGIHLKTLVSQSVGSGDPNMLEHDIDEIPRGQLVRLKNGGSAYGSRESLHKIGLETDDATPSMEHASTILAGSLHAGSDDSDFSPEEYGRKDVANLDDVKSPDKSLSILGELESQYRRLVRKYERLVDDKHKRASFVDLSEQGQGNSDVTPSDGAKTPSATAAQVGADGVVRRPKSLVLSKEVQTAYRRSGCLELPSPAIDPIEGHFDKGPPEYKKLFKEIFETLKRSSYVSDEVSPSGE